MTEPAPQNRGFLWATLFFRELYNRGIKHIVISPGSRSTPLTLAAASHSGFKKHVVLDERSAAFMALGIGKATGIPGVLICTSGTAPANYYPAIIESRLSGVPLIVATADRPTNLRGTGANQAIDQLKMFGDYPVFYHEAGEPRFEDADLNRLILLGRQAVYISIDQKGPVHLNFPFRKPLEPKPGFLAKVEQENTELPELKDEAYATQSTAIELQPEVRHLIESSAKPLIIAGPLASISTAGCIENLADILNAPVLSEGGFSSCNCIIKGYEGFLRREKILDTLKPDLILRFGFQPTGKAIEQALDNWRGTPHLHFASSGDWHDATFSVTHRVNWGEQPVKWNIKQRSEKDWLAVWKSAEKNFENKVQDSLSKSPTLTDLHVYHHLTPQIPEQWNIFLSNSFAARDGLLTGRFKTPNIYLNRGASGIDGITSTAMGVSLTKDQPMVLFTGDLAFLHDTNALLSQHLLNQPVIIVVINNNGGNIFRMLPIAKHSSYYRNYFETPQNVNITAMSNTYGIAYTQVKDLPTLIDLDLVDVTQNTGNGIHIVECQTDSDASMTLRNLLWSEHYAT